MQEWERTVYVANLVAARMGGFPKTAIADYESRGLRERYNKRSLFTHWVKKFEEKSTPPSYTLALPANWLNWASRDSSGKKAAALVNKTYMAIRKEAQRAIAATTGTPKYVKGSEITPFQHEWKWMA